MEWITKNAKELYISSSGLSKPADQFGFGYPFLSYKDVFHNYYAPDELTTLVNTTQKDREKCSVNRGDVFLTRTSETTEELGMSCVALRDYPEATFNGFAKRLRPITDEIYPEYAAYFFRSAFFRAQCKSMASLITRASLNDAMIYRFKIRFPKNKNAQIKIGTILKTYDTLIENNTKRIRLLEQMAENLYKEWFVRFRFPGHENVEMVNGLPKGWKVERIKECVIRLPFGKTYKANELQSKGEVIVIDQSTSDFLGYHNDAPSHNASFESPIILFGDHSCKFCLMTRKFSLGENVIPFISKETKDIDTCFLYFATHKLIVTEEYKRHWGRFSAMKILVPQLELQKKFSTLVIEFEQIKQKLIAQNELLSRQRDLLLPRLMSGKLEVKQTKS